MSVFLSLSFGQRAEIKRKRNNNGLCYRAASSDAGSGA